MMKESMIQVICGPGRSKTTSAIGRGLTALTKESASIWYSSLRAPWMQITWRSYSVWNRNLKFSDFEKTPVFL